MNKICYCSQHSCKQQHTASFRNAVGDGRETFKTIRAPSMSISGVNGNARMTEYTIVFIFILVLIRIK